MHRTVSLSLVIAVCLATKALAIPSITVGPGGVNTPYILPTGVSNNIIQILVSSPNDDDQVPGLNLVAQVGGVGPFISAVDIVNGTFFGSNRQGSSQNFGPLLPSRIVGFSNTTITGTVLAEGVLATLTLDTTGIVPGFYEFNLSGVPGLGDTDFVLDQFDEVIVANILNGLIQVVPEPSSILLGLFAAAGLSTVAIRRRNLRHAA